MDEYVAHSFGRIEAQLGQVLGELRMYGERTAEHGVRLGHVEDDVRELQNSKSDDVRQGVTLRAALAVGLFTVTSSGVASYVVALLTKGG